MRTRSIRTLLLLCSCLSLGGIREAMAASPGKIADLTYTQLARTILYPILLPEHQYDLRLYTPGSGGVIFYGDDFKHPSGYLHKVACAKTARFSIGVHGGDLVVCECQKQRQIVAQYARESRKKLNAYLATMPKWFNPKFKSTLTLMYVHKTLKKDVDLYYFPIFLAGRGGYALIYSAVVVSPHTAIVVQMVSEQCAQQSSKLVMCSDTQARLTKIATSVYEHTQNAH